MTCSRLRQDLLIEVENENLEYQEIVVDQSTTRA